jgi:hypothetical protein
MIAATVSGVECVMALPGRTLKLSAPTASDTLNGQACVFRTSPAKAHATVPRAMYPNPHLKARTSFFRSSGEVATVSKFSRISCRLCKQKPTAHVTPPKVETVSAAVYFAPVAKYMPIAVSPKVTCHVISERTIMESNRISKSSLNVVYAARCGINAFADNSRGCHRVKLPHPV